MIYCFVSDETFAVTGTQSVLSYDSVISSTLGMVDDNLLNYFVTHGIITDPIGTTYATNRISRLNVDDSNTVHSSVCPSGRMNIHFDQDKVTDSTDQLYLSMFTVEDNDDTTTRTTKIERRAALFNIIETIYMAHNAVSLGSNPKSVSELNTILAAAASTTYFGYVTDSLVTSPTVTSSYYYYNYTNGTTISRVATTLKLDFYDYFDFNISFSDVSPEALTIRVWLSAPQFKANYPYSTIVSIIYPCEPSWMLDPSSFGSEMEAVLSSSTYKDALIDNVVTAKDHSGATSFVSRYVHTTVPSDARMSFLVMYKGVAPNSDDMRVAIREQLLAETDSLGRILATEDEWKVILPDLFIDASFYLFPCYFQKQEYVSGVTIEQSVVNYRSLYNKTCKVLPNVPTQDVFDLMELMQIPGSKMYVVAYPVEGVSSDYTSILALHPTYQAIDSIGSVNQYLPTTDITYVYGKTYYYREDDSEVYEYTMINVTDSMLGTDLPTSIQLYERVTTDAGQWSTLTALSKEFAQLLANCLSVCLTPDSIHSSSFTESLVDGRTYYSFSVNFIEYRMLSYASSMGTFGEHIEEDCEHVDGYIH